MPPLAHGPPASVGHVALLVTALALPFGLYLGAVARVHRRGRTWRTARTVLFLLGIVLVALSVLPPLAPLADEDLRAHMAQHLLLGMFAPTALVLGAPISLALRSVPVPAARVAVRVLRTSPIRGLTHPVTALILNLGGMAALYFTPLYASMGAHPWLHALVHVHFLAAGALFAWSIAGPEHVGPDRPSFRVRLAVLFLGMATHATLAKAMFAHGYPRGTSHSRLEIEQAAQLMYYGGDLAELWLAALLIASWPGLGRRRRGASATRSTSVC